MQKIYKLRFKDEMMLVQNVISIGFLIIHSVILLSCKGVSVTEIKKINSIPVVIEFDTSTNKLIVDDEVNDEELAIMRKKVLKGFPSLSSLSLIHFQYIHNIAYYEYTGKYKNMNVNIFVFESSNKTMMGALESNYELENVSQFQVDTNGIYIYKSSA